ITVYRPKQPGIAIIAGYGEPPAGYGIGSQAEYASSSFLGPRVTDADIYAAIDATKAAGVIVWTRIANKFSRTGSTINGDALTVDGAPIIYPGQVPLETDSLGTNRNAMIGLGRLAMDVSGSSTSVSGLPCTATSPASMSVKIGAGAIYSLQNVDNSAYSSSEAD
ncbi:hypothetical protein OY671_009990, partial [Metschnikowia pulcherrima]